MNFKDLPDETLVGLAEDPNRGNGSTVEMMRRLKESINNLDRSSGFYSKVLIFLTVVIIFLTGVLIYLTYLLTKH